MHARVSLEGAFLPALPADDLGDGFSLYLLFSALSVTPASSSGLCLPLLWASAWASVHSISAALRGVGPPVLLVAVPLPGAGTLTPAGSAFPRLLQLCLVFEHHPLASQPDATPTGVHPCSGPVTSQNTPEHSELWPYSS